MVPLLPATGAPGAGLMVTDVVPIEPVHPRTVAETEYVPVPARGTPLMTGVCPASVHELGPLHAYVAPDIAPALKLKLLPSHTGELLEADGAPGVSLITTVVVPAALGGHPPTMAETEYVPLRAVVTPAMVGFCKVEVKEAGPVHE